MILFLLTFITFVFIIINLYLTKYDYMHPSVVFCSTFFICEIMCIIFKNTYAITLHYQTLLVLCTGFLIFTVITYLFKPNYQDNIQTKSQLQYIEIPKILIVLLIVLQILTIISFILYLKDIYYAYIGDTSASLSQLIRNYNDLTKFHQDVFRNLNIPRPFIFKIGYPIMWTFGFLVIYVMVNNFVVNKKIEILHSISCILFFIFTILTGSRFYLFKAIVFICVLFYVLSYKKGNIKLGSLKLLLKFIFVFFLVVILMFTTLFIIGRADTCHNIFNYLFVYFGAEIVNLNKFLITNNVSFFSGFSDFFGQQTFFELYKYVGKCFNIQEFLTYPTIEIFTESNNLSTGNEYTTYYHFIYDFGYIGIILIVIISAYFVITYNKCIKETANITPFDYKLFILSYLFSDLVFLFFANLFYAFTLNPLFFKFITILIIFNFINSRFKLVYYK